MPKGLNATLTTDIQQITKTSREIFLKRKREKYAKKTLLQLLSNYPTSSTLRYRNQYLASKIETNLICDFLATYQIQIKTKKKNR